MTTNRKAPVQIKVTSKTAAVRFHGHTVFEGWSAVLIIAIIMIARAVRAILCLTYCFLVWLLPILFKAAITAVAWAWVRWHAYVTR